MLDVSVVVPFYNRSFFLERLLDSILNQTRKPRKIYLVDNGSSDDEASKLSLIINKEKFKSMNIVYTSTVDKGNANYARNLGYILSDTKYVAFLDSDDWWQKYHLETSINILSESNKSGVYSGAIVHMQDNQYTKKSIDVNIFNNPFELILSPVGYLAQTSSYVVDKENIGNNVLWDEHLKRHQDFDYFASVFYNTDGWCYCTEANVNVDWDNGGTNKREIDITSLINFYEKWESKIPNKISKTYLLHMLRFSYKNNAPINIKNYYRNKILSNDFYNDYLYVLKSKKISIYSYLTITNTLDFFNLKNTIRKWLK